MIVNVFRTYPFVPKFLVELELELEEVLSRNTLFFDLREMGVDWQYEI